jgi:CheY-like chemotaxis protein/two-component sensor histidine kinase
MTLSLEEFALNDLVKEVSTSLESLSAAKKIALTGDCPEALRVSTDRGRLRQILTNLVGNAIKFTSAGQVSISVRQCEDPAQIEIAVRDTGIGIAEKDLPLLFQDFRQIDGSTTREYGGTGLGLSICKKLAELMGGTITAASKPHEGSVFTARLPIGVEARPAAVSARLASVPPGAKVILGIDDDPDMLKLLGDSLASTGFHFIAASSGDEGLALARAVKPYSILLDLMMPRTDGWAVLRELKNDPALKAVPVYVVSMVENQARAFELGVTGYIQKPFTQEDLLKHLVAFPRKSRQVMVVDDDADVRAMMTSALTHEGYEAIPVATGEEAVERLADLRPDALFLDLMLPGISGFDVLQTLDSAAAREPMSVIVMTAKELSRDEQDYLRRRAALVLHKASLTLPEIIDAFKKQIGTLETAA